jgi:uroporphyrin-III C-methyltransferase/precorrin-2 dehydrogenase/sirohydrochlorin ferrochelatase
MPRTAEICQRKKRRYKARMHALPLFVRLEDRPVILLGEGDAAHAKRRLLERAGARIVGEEEKAALAIVAMEEDAEAEAAIARLKARGVLVNAVDRPALCDFTLPAIIDRAPVLIAIGTDGASAGLAKTLRQRLEVLLPPTLGALAMTLKGAREVMRARWPEPRVRRHALDAALAEGALLDPFSPGAAAHVTAWLEGAWSAMPNTLRTLYITSDDPDQLTLEQARLLGQADTVIHAPDIAPLILARARADAMRIAAAHGVPDPLPAGLTLHLVRETRK